MKKKLKTLGDFERVICASLAAVETETDINNRITELATRLAMDDSEKIQCVIELQRAAEKVLRLARAYAAGPS